MILCVTPNPAVDHTLAVPDLTLGAVRRATQSLLAAGGKGLNAARALHSLGGDPLCLGPLGGSSGRLLADLAQAEGLRGAWTWIAGLTRTCVILIPEPAGESTVVNEAGPALSGAEWTSLAENCLRDSARGDLIAFCGSLPAGVDGGVFASLLGRLAAGGREVWVDTSGPALAAAAGVTGLNLKVNGGEAAALLDLPGVHTADEAAAAARRLLARGQARVIVTLGSQGAVAASSSECWLAQPPAVEVVSAVGSGDSFLGSWLLAREQRRPLAECLRQGVAAGTANALAFGGGRVSLEQVARLLPQVALQPIA